MEHKTLLVLGIVVFLLASLVCYIIGRVKLKKGEIVLVANGWDVALLLVSAVGFFLLWVSTWESNNWAKNEKVLFLCIGVAAYLGSVVMSVVHNKSSFGKNLVSALAKVIMVLLSVLALPVIAVTSFVISIIALIIRDFGLFSILNFKWLFKLIYGPRKSKIEKSLPEQETV
jgi:hypothetical protein